MNIYNLEDKIVIQVEELQEETLPIDYAVYEYTTKGCTKQDPILTGPLLEGKKAYLKLPDGKYNILVLDPEGQLGDIQQDFYVFYNRLPELVSNFQRLVCTESCQGCDKDTTEELLKLFYNVTIFLNCTGLIEDLPTYRALSCKHNRASVKEDENRNYYGRYNFKFGGHATQLILMFLLELYKLNISKARENNIDLAIIENMFKLEEIKACLLNSNVLYDDLESLINLINCQCNE